MVITKKYKILICIVFFVLFLSCNNHPQNQEDLKVGNNTSSVLNKLSGSSQEYLKSLGLWEEEGMNIDTHIKNNYFVLPAEKLIYTNTEFNIDTNKLEVKTYRGYTNIFPEQIDIHLFFDSVIAKEISISPGVYICDYIRFDKDITYQKDKIQIIPVKSDECGFMPEGSGVRGYAGLIKGDTLTMYTYLYIIKKKKGESTYINKTYPLLNPSNHPLDLLWNVGFQKK